MALLHEKDYEILQNSGLDYLEDEHNRLLVITNYPLPNGLYTDSNETMDLVEVLWVVPSNYNTSGGDMFWVHPALKRSDGKAIPNAAGFGGGDPRYFLDKEYCRWSRHWKPNSWQPKTDNIQKILDRIEWALRTPDANK